MASSECGGLETMHGAGRRAPRRALAAALSTLWATGAGAGGRGSGARAAGASFAAGRGPKPGSEKPSGFFHASSSRHASAPPATVTSLRFGAAFASALAACGAVVPSESRITIVLLSLICARRGVRQRSRAAQCEQQGRLVRW